MPTPSPRSRPRKARCVDGELQGGLPACPRCERGRIFIDAAKGNYACPGYWDSDASVRARSRGLWSKRLCDNGGMMPHSPPPARQPPRRPPSTAASRRTTLIACPGPCQAARCSARRAGRERVRVWLCGDVVLSSDGGGGLVEAGGAEEHAGGDWQGTSGAQQLTE